MTEDRRAQRSTSLLAVAALAWALGSLYRERPAIAAGAGATAAALALIAVAWPAGARAFHRAWMRLAAALGWLNSRIILTLFFFLVLTPLGLVLRLAGRDALDRRSPPRESYWVRRKTLRQPRERFERLY